MAGWAYFTAVQALSLSEAELTSYLNQPLNARVMLGGISPADAHRLLDQLDLIKENVRSAIQNPAGELPRKEQRYV